MVQEKSKIYGRDRKDVTLNYWQIAINQAAYELCQKDIALMYYRQALKTEAERKTRETYVFKKKSGSRSKEAEQTSSKAKKIKLSQTTGKKNSKNKLDISLKESHTRTKQISKAHSVKDYKQYDTLKTQLGTLFSEKSKLQPEAKQLLKKESKSTYYHNNKPEKVNEKEPKSRDIRGLLKLKNNPGKSNDNQSQEDKVFIIDEVKESLHDSRLPTAKDGQSRSNIPNEDIDIQSDDNKDENDLVMSEDEVKNCSETPEVMELDDSTDNMPNRNDKAAGEAVDILSSCKEPEENTDKTERDGNFLENPSFVTQ